MCKRTPDCRQYVVKLEQYGVINKQYNVSLC